VRLGGAAKVGVILIGEKIRGFVKYSIVGGMIFEWRMRKMGIKKRADYIRADSHTKYVEDKVTNRQERKRAPRQFSPNSATVVGCCSWIRMDLREVEGGLLYIR
jgi:hypothetical protein